MTAQIPDSVDYAGEAYHIAGISGGPLFEPSAHGLETVMTHTANYRGYVCHYTVRDGQLVLAELTDVGLPLDELTREPLHLPEVGGKRPVGEPHRYRYEALDLPIPFTGGLLLGADFLHEFYVHMGFHPAWKFAKVVELILDTGVLQRAHDRSKEMAAIREEIGAGARPNPDRDPEITNWIARAFELDYGRTFGG